MSEIMTPNDANFLGKVFGGRILSLVDLCAYTTAARFSGEVCVTASFDKVDFHEPIDVGEVVSMIGMVTYVGRTSVEVTIEVFAENVFKQVKRHTNTARVTMVAIRDGRPVPVPRLIFESREDKVRFLLGVARRKHGSESVQVRRALEGRLADCTDEDLDLLLNDPQAI